MVKLGSCKTKKSIVILTGKNKDEKFTGDSRFYEHLAAKVQTYGGELFILPRSGEHTTSNAFVWNENIHSWLLVPCPKPDIVYNRYPDRRMEWENSVQSYFHWLDEDGIPYFNRCFFNKLLISKLLEKDKHLNRFLPATEIFTTKALFQCFLKKYPVVFLKDVNGSQGSGIWKIERIDNKYKLQTQEKEYFYIPIDTLADLFQPIAAQKTLLMQQGISPASINNNPYDFRVLMHCYKNQWQLTGIGVRQAKKGGYTTHVPHGGTILSYDEVPVKPGKEKILYIGEKIGIALVKKYVNIREFSFDLAIDKTKKLWILDVNSKPMIFDESSIHENRIDILTNIFFE